MELRGSQIEDTVQDIVFFERFLCEAWDDGVLQLFIAVCADFYGPVQDIFLTDEEGLSSMKVAVRNCTFFIRA